MQSTLIIKVLENILNYLEPLLPTVNCHMVDFYTKNIYEKYVPTPIRNEIAVLDSNDALEPVWNTSTEYPELNKFVELTKKHTLPNFPEVCLDLNGLEQKLISLGCQNLSGLHLESFMSVKKSHEVEILSKIASAVSEIAGTSHVIDIGDGKGYLSSALAMHNNMRVLGIDSSVVNTIGAAKRVAKLNRVLKRGEKNVCDNELYKQTTEYITEDTNLTKLIDEHFPEYSSNKLGLVGLHTCGDLAPSCLRIFNTNENIKTLCNVGCCYHLLSEMEATVGFPMSDYLIKRQFMLGRNARMVAAQSLERMIHEKEKPSDILFYRSLLQVWLLKNAPHLLGNHAGRFKKPATFHQYVNKTLSKFNCDVLPTCEEITELYDSYLHKKGDLNVFYLIRAHLAPVVEAVILLDRLLYLHECGYENSCLVRLFDPVISPRCYGLISFK